MRPLKKRTGPTLTKLKHTRNKSWSLIHAVEWTATWRCHESIYESIPCILSWEDVGTLSQKQQSEIFQSASPVLCGSGNGILVQPTLQESEGVKLLLRIMWAEREKEKLLTNLQQWEVHQEINWIQDKPKWSLPARGQSMFNVFWFTSYHVSSSKDVWWPCSDVSVSHNRFNSYHMFEVVSSARRVRASNCTSSDLVSQICRSNCSTWKELMSQGNDFKWFQAYLSTWFLQKAATTWGVDRMLLSSVGRNIF